MTSELKKRDVRQSKLAREQHLTRCSIRVSGEWKLKHCVQHNLLYFEYCSNRIDLMTSELKKRDGRQSKLAREECLTNWSIAVSGGWSLKHCVEHNLITSNIVRTELI
jgi:hypothetical protein